MPNVVDEPRKFDTFLIPQSTDIGSYGELHLHIAITDPVDSGNGIPQILLVNISSIHSGTARYDKTCILHPDDHPFIKHDSYIAYQYAGIWELRDVKRDIKNFRIKRKERVRAEVGE